MEKSRKIFELYAKLPLFHGRITRTKKVISNALNSGTKWYVAFSGGKDSTVLFDLVLEQQPQIAVWWGDDGWDYPETLDFLRLIEEKFDLSIFRVLDVNNIRAFQREMGAEVTGKGWNPGPWDATVTSFDDHSRLVLSKGYGGVFLGLRAEESSDRRRILSRRGALYFAKTEDIYHCSPLADWTVMDVWAYIFSKNLSYNSVYDKLVNLGVPLQHCRVGPLTAMRVYNWGAMTILKVGWPDIFNRFAAEFPEVRCYV